MKLLAVAGVLAACGPGLKREEPKDVARAAFANAHDAAALEKLVRGPVMVGGLWFGDAECRAQFAAPQEVAPARGTAFARCLAMLSLQGSPRADSLGDVVVLTYEPGFEIEARVVEEADGARLTWIGYEAMRDDHDTLPTISVATLESLRMGGDANGGLDPAVIKKIVGELPERNPFRAAFAWMKLCIDATGNITSVQPRMVTSAGARDAFLAATNAWQFRPFVAAGQPMPVCAMVRPTAPRDAGPPTEALPFPAPPSQSGNEPLLLPEGTPLRRRSGESMIIPDDPTKVEIQQSGVSRVSGQFRICIDRTGKVESVLPFRPTGVPAYDRKIVAGVRTWIYQPYLDATGPIPVCTAVTFIYSQR